MEETLPIQTNTPSVESLVQCISLLQTENELLKKQLDVLQRSVIALQRGERQAKEVATPLGNQPSLFSLPALPEPAPAETIAVPAHTRKKAPRNRRLNTKELKRERIEHEPAEKACSSCGTELVRIGEEISEEIHYVPAQYVVYEHAKIKRSCPCCHNGVVTGVLPDGVRVLERCKAGAGLLAKIAVAKYMDGLPLHRQEQIFEREGLILPKASMSRWMGQIADLLKPVIKAMKREILSESCIHADETTLKRQDDNIKGLRIGYLWGVLGSKAIVFEYSDSRAITDAQTLLEGFKGYIHVDAYSAYGEAHLPPGVKRVCCWAHVKRKFSEGKTLYLKEQNYILQQISLLYRENRRWQAKPPEERSKGKSRADLLLPHMQRLHQYMLEVSGSIINDDLMAAINYTLKIWDSLIRVVEDDRLQLDNNIIERQMRPIAIGRKNYLFAGSEDGGEWAACFYSILNTCRFLGINPQDYLSDTLRKVSTTLQSDVGSLTPYQWCLAQQETLSTR